MKRQPNTPPLQFCLPAPVPPTCSSTADCQQRVRFLMMLLGSPRVARELQSWLLFLPSMETGRDRGKVGAAPQFLGPHSRVSPRAFLDVLPPKMILLGGADTNWKMNRLST